MNALRLLYIVPLYIFLAGVVMGWLTVLAMPIVRRYVEYHADKAHKHILDLKAKQDAILNPPTPLQRFLADDARKRAN